MQGDDLPDFGELPVRSNGTALTVAREVSAVTGAVRCGAEDYFRLLVGMKSSGPKSASMLTPNRLTSRCSSILSRFLRGEADFKRENFHRGQPGQRSVAELRVTPEALT
jgi:hypothetical protein